METNCNRCETRKKDFFEMDKNELLDVIHKLNAKIYVASKLLEIATEKTDLKEVCSVIDVLKGEL